jgi:hypothetical protein
MAITLFACPVWPGIILGGMEYIINSPRRRHLQTISKTQFNMDTRWVLIEDIDGSGFRHVYPNEDIKEHITEGVNCWCDPVIELENDLVIHNRVE